MGAGALAERTLEDHLKNAERNSGMSDYPGYWHDSDQATFSSTLDSTEVADLHLQQPVHSYYRCGCWWPFSGYSSVFSHTLSFG